ncbi:MAG: hypothetical protein ABI284_01285 [Nitrosospira sp.]
MPKQLQKDEIAYVENFQPIRKNTRYVRSSLKRRRRYDEVRRQT